MVTQYARIVSTLIQGRVDFIIVGGVAGNLHGSARATFDLDIVYSRSRTNITNLVNALASCAPYLRGAPPGLPFKFDEATVRNGLNFTLVTSLGDLDLLGEVVGGGNYNQLLPESLIMPAFGFECRCVNLDRLIQLKRAAGRPKDLEAIAELQALVEERARSKKPPQ